jgi:hypothetical protein
MVPVKVPLRGPEKLVKGGRRAYDAEPGAILLSPLVRGTWIPFLAIQGGWPLLSRLSSPSHHLPLKKSVNVSHLLLRPEFRVIFLQRRNLLQAVISGCIAKQTGVWKMWDLRGDITTVYANLKPIPLDKIAQTLAYQRELQEYYRQVIAHKPKDMRLILEYETFYTADLLQNRAAMQSVFGFLGLEMREREELDYFLNPRTSKINNQRTYTYVPNAKEINTRFGSHETGWLFEE